MLGSIAGDLVGSVYEAHPIKTKNFYLYNRHAFFTDDSVLTVATAYAILNDIPYAEAYKGFGRAYPARGYGGSFQNWLITPLSKPYFSFGNGSAMRVGPVGWYFNSENRVLAEAEKSAACTHNHQEGIKGAQAAALAVYLARTGADKDIIKTEIETRFGYNLERRLDEIRKRYSFNVTCQGSVPEAIIAFLESKSFEDALKNAVSLGGDADTQACIAGSIAEAYYSGIPKKTRSFVEKKLDNRLLKLCEQFYESLGGRG